MKSHILALLDKERGTALIAAVGMTLTLVGASTLYLVVGHRALDHSDRDVETALARIASDEGIYRAIAELRSGVDSSGLGLGNVQFVDGTGHITTTTAMSDLGGDFYLIHSRAQGLRSAQSAETVVEIFPGEALSLDARAAVAARGPVETTGNITIDGRNWNQHGTAIVGPGVHGVSSTDIITQKGASTIGGAGMPPVKAALPPLIEPLAYWGDGIDNDGDGLVDEEAWDGIDNDGDGLVDEDTWSYPDNPDVAFHLPAGTLKATAMAAGTFFSSQAQIDAYIAANGGNLPGGQIIYCEFPTWMPVNLGNQMNAVPSVIVHHMPNGTALAKNLHGEVKGLFLLDFVEHINGDFYLVGAVMSFAPESMGHSYGNGNAVVKYSSEVLSNLPAATATVEVRVHSWSRASNYK